MIVRRLAVAIGLLCALIGSQLPEFAQQYRQRLGGAIDELRRAIAQFDADAAAQSLTRAQGVERLEENEDRLARDRGFAMQQTIDRADRLERQREAFQRSGSLNRLVLLAENFDPATAGQAMKDFEPAVPVTVEAFVIGGLFLLFGYGATHLAAWPIRRSIRRRSLDRRRFT